MLKKAAGRPRNKAVKALAPAAASRRGPPGGVNQYIAGRLKVMYDELVSEPIPDRILELLQRLDSDAKK
jgi:Anti-sigma factor NepR